MKIRTVLEWTYWIGVGCLFASLWIDSGRPERTVHRRRESADGLDGAHDAAS